MNNLPITSNDLDGHECFFKLPGEDMRTDDLYMPYLNYFGTKGNVKKINISVSQKMEGAFGKEDYRTLYETEVHFDSKFRLVQEKHSRIVSVVHPTGNYSYDSKGHLKEVSITNTLKLIYERDERQRVVKVNAIDTQVKYVFTYEYGINDYIKSIKVYNSEGKLCGIVKYEYNNENRLIELSTDNNNKATKQNFRYDTNGALVWYRVYGNLKYKPREYDYYGYDNRYDNQKNVVEVITESGSLRENVLNNDFIVTENKKVVSNIKYDSKGNWVEIKQDNKRIFRKIIYKEITSTDREREFDDDKDIEYDDKSTNSIEKILQMSNEEEEEELIFTSADIEQMPEFPGGQSNLLSFLSQNIKYPSEAVTKGIQGRVICSFVVNQDGSIVDVEILRGLDSLLDTEAIRVINSMPKWIPGKKRGRPIRVKCTIPITFNLQ